MGVAEFLILLVALVAVALLIAIVVLLLRRAGGPTVPLGPGPTDEARREAEEVRLRAAEEAAHVRRRAEADATELRRLAEDATRNASAARVYAAILPLRRLPAL